MYCFWKKPLHVQQYIITIKTYNLKDKKYISDFLKYSCFVHNKHTLTYRQTYLHYLT